jgi:hypothetical protein
MSDYTPRMRALDRIARSISEHQPVRREDGPFSTCKNPACNGVIFVNIRARYEHQAIVMVNDLQRELDFTLQYEREDAEAEGRELTADDEAEIRSDFLVLAPAPEPASAAAVAALVRNAKADALIAAAEDAHSRGDIGKEGGVEAADFLASRAKRILGDGMFEFPHNRDTAPDADPRLAPAVDAFRREMTRHGALSSIRPVRDAMIAAFAAADAVATPKHRSAMEAAEATCDAFADRREAMFQHLSEQHSSVPHAPSSTEPTEASPQPEDLYFARFLPNEEDGNGVPFMSWHNDDADVGNDSVVAWMRQRRREL